MAGLRSTMGIRGKRRVVSDRARGIEVAARFISEHCDPDFLALPSGYLNEMGTLHHIAACLVCGDSFFWKRVHVIELIIPPKEHMNPLVDFMRTRRTGICPYCEECHETRSYLEKVNATIALGLDWLEQGVSRPDEFWDAIQETIFQEDGLRRFD